MAAAKPLCLELFDGNYRRLMNGIRCLRKAKFGNRCNSLSNLGAGVHKI